MLLLGGELDVAHAWRWLTYPLATQGVAIWVLLGLYCFYLFTSSLERSWGGLRLIRTFLVVSLMAAGCHWLGAALVTQNYQSSVFLTGLTAPALGMFIIWTSIHREVEILLFFVIPVKAKYIGIASIVLTALDSRGVLYALPLAALLTGLWFWAGRGVLGSSSFGGGTGVGQWFSQRRRAQRKSRFQVLQGGATVGPAKSPGPHIGEFRPSVAKPTEASEKELDRILDKIRYEGMEALTPEERAHLDRQSQRLRGD